MAEGACCTRRSQRYGVQQVERHTGRQRRRPRNQVPRDTLVMAHGQAHELDRIERPSAQDRGPKPKRRISAHRLRIRGREPAELPEPVARRMFGDPTPSVRMAIVLPNLLKTHNVSDSTRRARSRSLVRRSGQRGPTNESTLSCTTRNTPSEHTHIVPGPALLSERRSADLERDGRCPERVARISGSDDALGVSSAGSGGTRGPLRARC